MTKQIPITARANKKAKADKWIEEGTEKHHPQPDQPRGSPWTWTVICIEH